MHNILLLSYKPSKDLLSLGNIFTSVKISSDKVSLGNGIINVSLFFLNLFTSIFLIIDSLIFNLNVLVIKFTPFNSITLSNLYFFMIETSFFLKEIFDFTIVKFS